MALLELLVTWRENGGNKVISAMDRDQSAVRAATKRLDNVAIATACRQFSLDAAKALQYAPLPDSAAEGAWAKGLADYKSGAEQCTAGASGHNTNEENEGVEEMQAGTQVLGASADLQALRLTSTPVGGAG
jgi:hypothetical protein